MRVLPADFEECCKALKHSSDTLIPDLRSVPVLIHFVEAASNLRQPFLKRFLPVAYWLICIHASADDIVAYTKVKEVSDALQLGRVRILSHLTARLWEDGGKSCDQIYHNSYAAGSADCARMKAMKSLLPKLQAGNFALLALTADELAPKLELTSSNNNNGRCSDCRCKIAEWNPGKSIWEKLPEVFGVSSSWSALLKEWEAGTSKPRFLFQLSLMVFPSLPDVEVLNCPKVVVRS
jgi:hypothetical protein